MNGDKHLLLRSENLAFDIDVWYPPLAEHYTFGSVFIPLTRAEAQAVLSRITMQPFAVCPLVCLPKDLTSSAVVETLLNLEKVTLMNL